MPIITSIKPQRNKRRVNIYLDGIFGFGLDLENFVNLNLKVSQEFTEKEIKQLVKKANYAKTSDKLLRFATLRPRSEKEIRLWFAKHKVHESIHEKLLNKLKHLELLDDEKFAKWWVEQRIQFKSKSKREIIQELKYKGISKIVIDETLSSASYEEDKHARDLLSKKAYKWQKLDESVTRRKMIEYLSRKGFDWDVTIKVVDSYIKNE
jgi:regulatory protein